jgi:hypothetical protein
VELDGPAVSALRRAIAEVKQRWSVIGWVTKNLLSRAPPCFGRLVKPLVQTVNRGRRGGLWPFSLCVIHKEGLCPSSGDINRLMMIDVDDRCFSPLLTYLMDLFIILVRCPPLNDRDR